MVVGSLKFYEREEIKDALSYLALCANQKDEISFRRVINKPTRGIGEKTQDKIMEAAVTVDSDGNPVFENLLETTSRLIPELSKKAAEGAKQFVELFSTVLGCFDKDKKLSDFIERVIRDSALDEFHKAGDEIDGTTRVQNLQELVNSAVPYECSMEGLLAFLDAINLDRTLEKENEVDQDNAVTLITLHNTKGLEYNKVVITGLEEGVFPRMGKTGMDLEEERRLFYVGITRAKDELYLTTTASRRLYGRAEWMSPSPFLAEINRSSIEVLGERPARFYFAGEKDARAGSNQPDGQSKKDPLFEHWKPGTKVYHDDFGYGIVCKAGYFEGDFVIFTAFESGAKKQFMPEHCSGSLMRVKD